LDHQYDYTKGQLSELTDVIVEKKAALFVCAVGVPPKDMVDRLHAAGILVMKCVLSPDCTRKGSHSLVSFIA
jgi:NAD(P)H-dependent flavin oxidoreductase YrpB (nitropropane dioxygenase family)